MTRPRDTPFVRTHAILLAALGGTALGLFASMPTARGDAKGSTIGVDEIQEGMKGYGLTVFHGTEPEKFDVEVIGVLHNFRAGQDLILVKTPHPRLNITRNVQGMSGSPIYLDGRLAGAYAYSLRQFMVEPVAGVTPIAPMLGELHRPIPPGFWPLQQSAPLPTAPAATVPKRADADGPTHWDGAPGRYDVMEHAHQVASRMGVVTDTAHGIVPVSTPLLVAGLGERCCAKRSNLSASTHKPVVADNRPRRRTTHNTSSTAVRSACSSRAATFR
jgi:SpoIVB peptidase S55